MSVLDVEHLTHYFGGLCAIDDFNLAVEHGELVGIIGPNGAGKTTVFNLLTSVYRATRGSIRFNDRELVGMKPYDITSIGIARTFQTIRLFKDLTVLDNVRIAFYSNVKYGFISALFHLGAYHREEKRITEESMNLLALFDLDAYAEDPARSLPYGMQRKLEIVRALSTKPKLLLLDEPAAGMNPREINKLMSFIQWIRKEFDLTILLIEHQMRLVMGICERLVVLDFGATIAEGIPAEIQNNQEVLTAYLGEEK
jgi:branched-chain amino acid transport system ATP-binding protein